MKKSLVFILIAVLLSVPSFYLMLRHGIFSTQDFHYFRLIEFDKCIKVLQIPCRWAPDSGAGFGEPLFNFYAQFSYLIGEIFHLASLQKIDSLKIVFILSLVLSGISMFLLSKKIWKNDLPALVSSTLYIYAPYRAVDVWVRGALPESFSFVLFPLIILEVENYLEKNKNKDLLLFSLLFGLLIITHNLSLILFSPFLAVWIIYKYLQIRKLKPFINLFLGAIFSLLLTAFYILPVIFESQFININSTTVGYFDWRAHFVTIKQLFLSRFWGYGASTWGEEDGLSLSVGHVQWIIPLSISLFILIKRKFDKNAKDFIVLISIGIFALFLTHNKSTPIWEFLSFMKYIQFPWRFLGIAVFAFSLATGFISKLFSKKVAFIQVLLITITIVLNFQFFKPDIWYKVSDTDLETGSKWKESTFASINDYWPRYGNAPSKTAWTESADVKLISKNSSAQIFSVQSHGKEVEFPIAYFPGWKLSYNGKIYDVNYDSNGLITASLPKEGSDIVTLKFENTPIRTLGNIVSLMSLGSWALFFVKFRHDEDN